MRKLLFLLLLSLIASSALLISCDTSPAAPGSSEALITAYTSDYLAGDPVIDPENKTIAVTVKPIDLSVFVPVVTVSSNATITPPASIRDGVAEVYTVTAENGDSAEWKVIVTVQYGISFNIDGTTVYLTAGFKDSTDPTEDNAWGSGVPGIARQDGYSEDVIFKNVYDWGVTSAPPEDDYCYFRVESTSTGTVSGSLEFYDFSGGSQSQRNFDLTVNISEFGLLGENFIGAFSGTEAVVPGRTSARAFGGGFAKLRVVEKGLYTSSPSSQQALD